MNERLRRELIASEQHTLLNHCERLSPPEQSALEAQLAEIDFAEYRQLRSEHTARRANPSAHAAIDFSAIGEPSAVRLGEEPPQCTRSQARQAGETALRGGEIGMILVAGGLGTRLGFDMPKGMFKLGPLSQRTLFEILIDSLRAVSKRFGVRIPLYVMTSPATHDVTVRYFAENRNCGLSSEDLTFFRQGTMYAVDASSFDLLLADRAELFTGPDGHGGMLKAFAGQGHLACAQARGVKHFFYGQIDNPLLTVCDPEFLGMHLLATSQLTTQAVRKIDPAERVGIVGTIAGKTQVIEYIDLPKSAAEARLVDGSLRLWAGNTAVHAFEAKFLETCAASSAALPLHTSLKKVPYWSEHGIVKPETSNAIRFERFIFDLLPQAERTLTVEIDPKIGFAPVKNDDSAPTDSPLTARRAMIARDRALLRQVGVSVSDDLAVEVNPLWAYDSAEAATKLGGKAITQPTYFAPEA